MKRILCLFLIILSIAVALSSCELVMNGTDDTTTTQEPSNTPPAPDDGGDEGGETPDTPDTPENPDTPDTPDTPDNPDKPSENDYLYKAFTPAEKALFEQYIGIVIPFMPNNEYYVEGYYEEDDYENGLYFATVGNTEADFAAYRALFSDFTPEGTDVDDDGDTWYFYVKDDVLVEMCHYVYEGERYTEVYVSLLSNGDDGGDEGGEGDYIYTDFTAAEKALFEQYIGVVIPFMPNNEYAVEGYYEEFDYENGLYFGVVGCTQAEFDAYRELYASYTSEGEFEDDYGDTWYGYSLGDVVVYMVYYTYEGENYAEVYVVSDLSGGDEGGEGDYIYTDFTTAEKALFEQYIGVVIPFMPNNEYAVEGYYEEFDYENGLYFGAVGNTAADFAAYRALYSAYTFDGTYEDDYGDTWYSYSLNGVYVDMVYYTYEGETYTEVFVYSELSGTDKPDDGGDDDYNGFDQILTNDGKGLPEDEDGDGVFDVDFTDAEYVKDATDRGYFVDGCPPVGSPAVLVIPVEFSDARAADLGYTLDKLQVALTGANGEVEYYSLYEYYYISSYGQLTLDITLFDGWFCPKYPSTYYERATIDYYGEALPYGEQLVLDEALAYLATIMDLSAFDSDHNGIIDAVIMIYTLDVDPDSDFQWAFRNWNIYTDADDYYYEYDGVSANDYVWMSYAFMFETYDASGDLSYEDTGIINTYTFIHEFAHVLGIDDYYDTMGINSPLGGYDVMDSMAGDHNPFTKFNYGWITESRLVVTTTSVTLNLHSFAQYGDTIILANDWDPTLGAYQEYYVIMYYTCDGLNGGDYGYFDRDGILVYHVNASLGVINYQDGELYYEPFNTNTHPSDTYYGSEDELIEFVLSRKGNYTYVAGDTLTAQYDDAGEALGYTFTVDSIEDGVATITFTYIG